MRRRDTQTVSRIMGRVKDRDTGPELKLRRALHAAGYRFRLHCQNLTGNPDIVMPGRRIAVFVDGDVWHGNQWRLRGHSSLEEQYANVANRDYWLRACAQPALAGRC